MDPVFFCKKCSNSRPCCPVCFKTDVKYICTTRDNLNHIDVVECLDPECPYGSSSTEDEEMSSESVLHT